MQLGYNYRSLNISFLILLIPASLKMYQHQDQTQHQYYQQYNSYNPSIEDLIASSDDKRYQNGGIGNLLQRPPVAGLPYISSQVNPNTSSANLSKLTSNINNYGYNNNNNSHIQLHTPPLSSNPSFTSFQNLNYPLSPLSKPTSPEPILSAASVTTSNFLASSFSVGCLLLMLRLFRFVLVGIYAPLFRRTQQN